ncbi:MAG TPA: hypothetical protein VN794_07830, partial [Methylomirabilota bacterium]|nr:hypothetical protein [Methylomirabilota bacterium]
MNHAGPLARSGIGRGVMAAWVAVLCWVWVPTAVPANPFIYALDSAVLEGNSGITNLVFTVALS